MPPQVRPLGSQLPGTRTGSTYSVKPGDSLWVIAARTLGRGDRWGEIYNLNRGAIGASPADLKVGTVLRLPGGQVPNRAADALPDLTDNTPRRLPNLPTNGVKPPTKPPTNGPIKPPARPPANPVKPPVKPPVQPPVGPPADSGRDSDGDGVSDRYDRAPADSKDKRWNQVAAREYGEFAKKHSKDLKAQGVEVDCADFAVKLLEDFCKQAGLPNPFAGRGKWSVYTPENTGGLANVKGPNWFRSGLHADNLAKEFTHRVNDANKDGFAGFEDGLGIVDANDLRPGDILFYDWDDDGEINHTVNVLDVADDGTVTIAFGTYDNTAGEGKPLTWENLDLAPITIMELKPGTEESLKYLGPLNHLWGARRFNWMPDEPTRQPRKAAEPAAISKPAGEPIVAPPASNPAAEPATPGALPTQARPLDRRPLAVADTARSASLRYRLEDVRQFLLGA